MSSPTPTFQDASGLLPTEPPARVARWTGMLLLAISIAAIGFSVWMPLPEVAVAPFVLVPARDADDLQAPMSGKLSRVLVAEGQQVDAGALMFELENDELRRKRSQLRQWQDELAALHVRVEQLEKSHEQAMTLQRTELASAERELAFSSELVSTQSEVLARAERLGSAGVVAEVELLKYRLALSEAQKERVLGERTIEGLRLSAQQRGSQRETERSDEAAQERRLREQMLTLERELVDSEGDRRQVRAPYPASVLRLPTRTPGAVVNAGDVLAQLARVDGGIKARLQLPEAALPRLQVHQRVRLQFDAYPVQRYGSVDAEVQWLGPEPLVSMEISAFVADASIHAADTRKLQVGMRGQARVVVGQRTLLERGLDALRGVGERLR